MTVTQAIRDPRWKAALAATFAVALLALASFVGGDESSIKLERDDDRVVKRGKTLYAESCASCHGERLEGEPDWPDWRKRKANGRLSAPPHDESGHTWHHDDPTLFRVTKYGLAKFTGDPDYATDMPAYEALLSNADIVAVLSYIKSTWDGDARTFNDQVNDPARRLQ